MSDTTRAVLLGVFTLASGIWVGGYVAIAAVASAATATLDPDERVACFRALGRKYLLIGGVALAVALGTGAALLSERTWDGILAAAVAVAGALVVALAVGVAQARRMTRLRRAALAAPEDQRLARRVERGARRATVLRAAIGLLSLALIALGALLAT
jgi:uncharacterized membrane protein